MKFQLVTSAILAFALTGISVECRANESTSVHSRHAHHHIYSHHRNYHSFYSYGYVNGRRVGGYRYWYNPSPATWPDTYGYPGFYNLQTFWERVETQRNYPVQY